MPVLDRKMAMTQKSETPLEERPQVVNLAGSQAEQVEADLVRASRSYVGRVNAEEADLHQSIAINVDVHTMNTNASLVGLSQATSTQANNSAIIAGRADHLELRNSVAAGIYAASTTLSENSQTGILVSGDVKADQVRTVVLVARQVQGPVQTMLDTRQVALGSLIAGIAGGAVMLLGYFLFRHKK